MTALVLFLAGNMAAAFLVLFGLAVWAPLPIVAGMMASLLVSSSKRWSQW